MHGDGVPFPIRRPGWRRGKNECGNQDKGSETEKRMHVKKDLTAADFVLIRLAQSV
ncbi:MAG: hypothetical protein AB7U47_08705 [Variibacter sp.]